MFAMRSLARLDRLARPILGMKGALEHVDQDREFFFLPKTVDFANKGNIEMAEETQFDLSKKECIEVGVKLDAAHVA